ncbi:MAG: lipid-A-disaccharide synthase [Planctomycetota bacterium]|nr:lipid-A-disaccharide synthase [Planctomycetota bacterium]
MARLLVCAGEPSGDLHAARLVEECLKLDPSLQVDGIGGEHLAASGAVLRADCADRAVMGWLPVLGKIGSIMDHASSVVEELLSHPPDQLVVIDYPGLHYHLATIAKRLGIPVTYYICPQVWAWAPWRIRRIASCADQLLVVLPFEEEIFSPHHPRVRHVGNPVFDTLEAAGPPQQLSGASGAPILALLPGSRRQELRAGLPALLEASRVLTRQDETLETWISCQRSNLLPLIEQLIEPYPGVRIHVGEASALQARARLAIVCSGTATLETAWHGVPMVVAYPATEISRSLYQLLGVSPYFSLVNLFAGRRMVPEVLFEPGDGEAIARIARPLLQDQKAAELVADLRQMRDQLFRAGASQEAAKQVISLLHESVNH